MLQIKSVFSDMKAGSVWGVVVVVVMFRSGGWGGEPLATTAARPQLPNWLEAIMSEQRWQQCSHWRTGGAELRAATIRTQIRRLLITSAFFPFRNEQRSSLQVGLQSLTHEQLFVWGGGGIIWESDQLQTHGCCCLCTSEAESKENNFRCVIWALRDENRAETPEKLQLYAEKLACSPP